MCALHCAQLLHTILHRTDLIIFPLTLQTITIAPMMSIWGKGGTALYIQTFRSPSQHITQRLHDNSTNVSLLPPNGSILSLLNFSYMMNMPPKIRHIKHTHKIARAGLKLCGTLGPNHFVGPHYTYCIQYSEFWHVLPCSASTARDKKRSSITLNKNSIRAFQRAINQGSTPPHNFLKMGVKYLNL